MYVPKHLLRILRRDWDRRYNDLETHMLNVLSCGQMITIYRQLNLIR